MISNGKPLLWLGLGVLVAVEVVFFVPLLKALLQVAVIASRWPHLIADSAVFLQQQPLHQGLAGWLDLLNPVNEHRVVVSRLIAVLPLSFGGEFGIWSVGFSLLLLALSLGWIVLILRRLNPQAPLALRLMVGLLCGLILANPWQLENLIWDINVHWFFQGWLLLVSLHLLLSNRSVPPLWLDLLLPGLALLNGGLGVALLLSYSLIRLLAFGRRWLIVLSAVSALLLYSLTSLASSGSPLNFSGIFTWRMLQIWWPHSGLWMVASALVVVLMLWRHWKELSQWDQRQLLVCCLPGAYAIAFAVLVDLSRSAISPGLVMRESYVTPALMLGLSLIFLTWKLCAERLFWRWALLIQAGWLLLLLHPREAWSIAPGLNKPHFSRQVARLINEQDRRITWFHCAQLEAGASRRNCPDVPFYDGWNVIRSSMQEALPLGLRQGSLSPSQAKARLRRQQRADLQRLYLVRADAAGQRWITGRRQGEPRMGDLVLQMGPGQEPAHWVVTE